MRLDPDHVKKLRAAICMDGGKNHVDIDVEHLSHCMQRLSLWEGGLLIDVLMRAAETKRLSREQRVLLSLFVRDHAEEAGHAAE